MSYPKERSELLSVMSFERERLIASVEKVPLGAREQAGACESWSVKDILAHLTDWQERLLGWVDAGFRGETPAIPDEHFNWRQLSELNQVIYEKHKDKSYSQVLQEFTEAYQKVTDLIISLPDEDLFAPDRFAWTKGKPLVVFVDANAASHDRWASKLIGKFGKNLPEKNE